MSALNWHFPAAIAIAVTITLALPPGSRAQTAETAGTAQTIDTVRDSAMENSAVTVLGRVESVDRDTSSFTLSDETGEIDISTVTPPDTLPLQEGQQVRVSGTVSALTFGEKNIVATTIDVIAAPGEEVSEGRKGSQQARQAR
jgi:hypothetical protein